MCDGEVRGREMERLEGERWRGEGGREGEEVGGREGRQDEREGEGGRGR